MSVLFPVLLLWAVAAWINGLLVVAIPITLFAGFLGLVLLAAWRGLILPTRYELVVDGPALRWGEVRKPQCQSAVKMSEIAFLCQGCGSDNDKSFVILKSGAQLPLPQYLVWTRNDHRALLSALRSENAEIALCQGDGEASAALARDSEVPAQASPENSRDSLSAGRTQRQGLRRFSHSTTADEDVVKWSYLSVGLDVRSFVLVFCFVAGFVGVISWMTSVLIQVIFAAAVGGEIVAAVAFSLVLLSLLMDWRFRRAILGALARFTGASSIRVSHDHLSVEHRDLLNSEALCVARSELKTLHYRCCPLERSAALTLIVRSADGGLRRHDLALAMGRNPKAALYRLLREILVRRGWQVNCESHPDVA
ncbi:MAG: hypothetical protein ABR915_11780 [Thermoguttaceae bacterium]